MTRFEIEHMWKVASNDPHHDYNWNDAVVIAFANLVEEHVRNKIYAEEFELPKPRLTGKFSITAGKFKCTGCTGNWTNSDDAKHHSCKDYQ
jgi:hypothetical protein